jgi:hypothetical protein
MSIVKGNSEKMQNSNHIINRQVFEFSCSHYEDAFQLQKQLEGGLQHDIEYCIDTALSEWNDTGETLRIDKLEIDIGEIPFDSLAILLHGKIYTVLKDKLVATVIPGKAQSISQEQAIARDGIELIEIFLLSGSLPWWVGHAANFSLTEAIQQLLKDNSASINNLLLKNLFNKKFTERLSLQIDANLLENLTTMLPDMQALRSTLEKMIDQSFVQNSKKEKTAENGSAIIDAEDLKPVDISKNISQLLLKIMAAQPLPPTVEQFELLIKEKTYEIFGKTPLRNRVDQIVDITLVEEVYSIMKSFERNISDVPQLERFSDDITSLAPGNDKIYIQNAGLALITAFMPALFKELHWIENGVFRNRTTQLKALFLLHYITTGIDEAPEYTLQLNKILCGFALDEPIPFSVELTAEEKKEADQLLQDVVDHWTALNRSTANALRGSFLLRDALLSRSGGRWLLQVERKGYDVLVDKIPWSWKVVKFGWMENYIDIEW